MTQIGKLCSFQQCFVTSEKYHMTKCFTLGNSDQGNRKLFISPNITVTLWTNRLGVFSEDKNWSCLESFKEQKRKKCVAVSRNRTFGLNLHSLNILVFSNPELFYESLIQGIDEPLWMIISTHFLSPFKKSPLKFFFIVIIIALFSLPEMLQPFMHLISSSSTL